MKNLKIARKGVQKYIALLVAILLLVQITYAQENPAVSDAEKQVIFNKAISLLYENYIFPERVKKIETTIAKKFANNGYKDQTTLFDFLENINKDFESLGNDHHLNIFYGPSYVKKIRAAENDRQSIVPVIPAQFLAEVKYENFFLKKAERLDGNVGYFKFNKFEELQFAKESISAAMNFISHSSAIIIDLRENGGGSAETVHFLESYFLPDSTKLGQFRRRINNEVVELWTIKDPVIKKIPDSIPLFILVSKITSSAAESFAYGLQQFKRATVIGAQTHGEGNPGKRFVINESLYIMIPTATNINIITGTNWEGTGVTPNMLVAADLALPTAIMESYINLEKKSGSEELKQLYQWMIPIYESQINPIIPSEEFMNRITGKYGEKNQIKIENGNLFFINSSGKYKMTYMKNNTFLVEGKQYRLRFPKGDLKPGYYEAVWVDGGTERSNRVAD
jgi:hypothetical protein